MLVHPQHGVSVSLTVLAVTLFCSYADPSTANSILSTTLPKLECFCNGFPDSDCIAASDWYQAQVVSNFSIGTVDGWSVADGGGQISVASGFLKITASGKRLRLAFPSRYLRDKRTSYQQALQVELEFPELMEGKDPPRFHIEMKYQLPNASMIVNLDTLCSKELMAMKERHVYEITFQYQDFVVMRSIPFLKNKLLMGSAEELDLRQTLADIQSIFLEIQLPEATSEVNLYSVTLPYARYDPENGQGEPVGYVEECTKCTKSRTGPHCGSCADGYSYDPPYGGEFARCAECLCFLSSESCDPVSNMCFNCSGNRVGNHCERCAENYFGGGLGPCRPCDCGAGTCDSVTGECTCPEGFGGERCDECQDGFWMSDNTSCVSCDCNEDGSLSLVCDEATGICPCVNESIVGRQCNLCARNTTGIFPSCAACGECTEQWWPHIDILTTEVAEITKTVAENISVVEVEDEALLELLDLVQRIRNVLELSQLDRVVDSIEGGHSVLSDLLNETNVLLEEARDLAEQLEQFRQLSERFNFNLTYLRERLSNLTALCEQISADLIFDPTITDFNITFWLNVAREALSRSNATERLASEANSNLTFVRDFLDQFADKLETSDVTAWIERNEERISNISQDLSAYELFLEEANALLCGSNSSIDSCDGQCGGLSCMVCGGRESGCSGIISNASEAENITLSLFGKIRELLSAVRMELEGLKVVSRELESTSEDAASTREFANETHDSIQELSVQVDQLRAEVLRQINSSMNISGDIAGLEAITLSIQLPVTVEEFTSLVMNVSNTIDEIRRLQEELNATDLIRRAMEAKQKAENASILFQEVNSSVIYVQEQVERLLIERTQAQERILLAQQQTTDAQQNTNTTQQLLGEIEAALESSQRKADALLDRLKAVREDFAENQRDFGRVRNSTELANETSHRIAQETEVLSSETQAVAQEANTSRAESERALEIALQLRQTTDVLAMTTQDQLLLMEELERREKELVFQQSEIKSDINRIAVDLDLLSSQLQTKIGRNTRCLDVLQINKKRRSSRSQTKRNH